MYKDVEFVDTDNMGRSLIAEAVARKFLSKQDLLDKVNVRSSGILVTPIKNYTKKGNDYQLLKLFGQYIDKFLSREIITPRESKEWRKIIKRGNTLRKRRRELRKDKVALKHLENSVGMIKTLLYNESVDVMGRVERIIEKSVLKKYFDIEKIHESGRYGPEYPKQTKVRKNAELIFPMDKRVYARVKKLYSGSKYKPQIKLLIDYAGIKGEIEDPYLATAEEHKLIAEQIEETTKRALEECLK